MKVFTINYLIIGNTFDNDFTFHSLIDFANTGCKKIKTVEAFSIKPSAQQPRMLSTKSNGI